MAASNEWPRGNRIDDRAERALGVWLHTQRIDYPGREADRSQGSPAQRRHPRLTPGQDATGSEQLAETFTLVRIPHLFEKLLRDLRHQVQRLFLSYRQPCVGPHVERHRSS